MTKEEAQQFKARWKLANDFTDEEVRRMMPEEKLRQVALLYELGQALGWPDDSEEVAKVRERWRRLKEYYEANR
ncbi:MAG TPA: hypothetical protein VE713_02410 [Pyrinomonadaceae bacterium]|jgi:hypothetical protein|nr:hypothetical protein [Pyrinomonadaceae bacterium]